MSITRHKIGRREFLRVSSTCALAAAAVGPRLWAADALSLPKRLAVGFASFDDPAALIAASGVTAGDGGFIRRGARITASGASGASPDPQQRRGVELLAHYSYFDGAERRVAPFRAWAGSRTTGCQGNSVNFNVPMDVEQQIRLSVTVESGVEKTVRATSRRRAIGRAAVSSHELPVTLSLLSEPGSLKLVRGFYAIVPLFENDGEPRWGSYGVKRHEGRWALVDGSGALAPFEHFVLGIDYASS